MGRLSFQLKPYQLFSGLLLVSLVAISLQFKNPGGETVFKKTAFSLAAPVGDTWHNIVTSLQDNLLSFSTITGLQAENRRLLKEIDRLQFERRQAANRLDRAGELESLLKLVTAYSREGVAVEITTRGFQVWDKTVVVRGGLRQGLADDLPVLDWQGVAGKTIRCSENHSEVALVTNAGFAMAGWIPARDVRGVVRGRGNPRLSLELVTMAQLVKIGDWVFSSGDDGIFPAGFPVGQVSEVDKSGQYFQDITLNPAVNVSNQRFLFVLKTAGGDKE